MSKCFTRSDLEAAGRLHESPPVPSPMPLRRRSRRLPSAATLVRWSAAVLAFIAAGLLLGAEFESTQLGFLGACMLFLMSVAVSGIGSTEKRR